MTDNMLISKQCCDCKDPPDAFFYKPWFKGVTPKSLATELCVNRDMYNCTDTRITRKGKGPSKNNDDVYILNPNFGLTDAANFYPDQVYSYVYDTVDEEIKKVVDKKCPKKVCATYCDPRVRNAVTGDLIKLDRVPYTGHVPLSQVYNEKLRNYGKNYTTYSDIHAGQIRYYVPDEDEEAFQSPNYTLTSNTLNTVRQDPMGALLPEYYRDPVTNGLKNESDYQDTRDQLRYREDIMDGIMYTRNKRNWGVMWHDVYSKHHPKTHKEYQA